MIEAKLAVDSAVTLYAYTLPNAVVLSAYERPACDATSTEYAPQVVPVYVQRSTLYPVTAGPPAGAPHDSAIPVAVGAPLSARTPARVDVPVADTYAQSPRPIPVIAATRYRMVTPVAGGVTAIPLTIELVKGLKTVQVVPPSVL